MKNFLFIGGAGFIGSNIIRAMHRYAGQYRIHVLEPFFSNVSSIDGFDVTLHRGMLFDTDLVKTILVTCRIDIVIHLVSTLVPGSTYKDYEEEYKNVIFPTIRLMQVCCEQHVKFVYFSSGGTIYGNRYTEVPFKESDAMCPISYYGWSKQMMENSILFIQRTLGLEYLILRPSNPYGHGQNLYGKQGFIAVCIGKILEGKTIEVWGDGMGVRDYIFIEDLVEIFLRLIEMNTSNETLNIGSGLGYTNIEVLKILENIINKRLDVIHLPARAVDVSKMILDNHKVLSYIGEYDFVKLETGVKKFYDSVINIAKR